MKIRHLFSHIIFSVFLVACGGTPSQPIAMTTVPLKATMDTVFGVPTFLPTFTASAPLPDLPTPTSQSTQTPLPASLPKFPLDGYIMLFTKNGGLYFQDENNLPVKLTDIGEVYYILSDDNQKIAVIDSGDSYAYHDWGFTINIDGSQKRSIVPGGWPEENLLWRTKIGIVDFIPGTHQLIFSTHSCNSSDNPTSCVSSIFLVDTDTGDVKKIADLGFSGRLDHENFKVSPNGKMVAIMTTSSVDILDMDGRIIRHDILFYRPNTPAIIFPSIFWLPDSNGLIVALPNALVDSMAFDYVPAYTIWRYEIDSDVATQIQFDPPPMAFSDSYGGVQVSPDGKWIIHGGPDLNWKVYLGNLANGRTLIVGEVVQAHFSWSPDSRYFIVTSAGNSSLGSTDNPDLVPIGDFFAGWVDGSHFNRMILQKDNRNFRMGIAEINSQDKTVSVYDLGLGEDVGYSFLIKPK